MVMVQWFNEMRHALYHFTLKYLFICEKCKEVLPVISRRLTIITSLAILIDVTVDILGINIVFYY
jgi:hypothetical protein